MAINKAVMVNDGGSSSYSNQVNWNSLIDNNYDNRSKMQYVYTTGSGKTGVTPSPSSYNDLPEAEVEVLPKNYYNNDNSGGWFYQQTPSGNQNSNDDGWFYQSSGGGNAQQQNSYDYNYYVQPVIQDTSNYSRQFSKTLDARQPVAPVQNPTVSEESAPVQDNNQQQQQVSQNLIQSLLQQTAAADNQKPNASLPLSVPNGIINNPGIQFGIQQAIDQANAENAGNSAAPQNGNDQSIMNWAWRNGGNALDALMNLGVTPAYGASDIPVDYGSGTRRVLGTYPTGTMDYLQQNNLPLSYLETPEGQNLIASLAESNANPARENGGGIRNLLNNVVNWIGNSAHEIASDYDTAINNAPGNITQITQALQDPQWLQDITEGRSLTDFILGVKPGASKDFVLNTLPSGLESLGDRFRTGFDYASEKFGQSIDLADKYARQGLDFVTENVLQPGLEKGAEIGKNIADDAVYARTGKHYIADKPLYDYMRQTGKSLEDLDDADYRAIYESTRQPKPAQTIQPDENPFGSAPSTSLDGLIGWTEDGVYHSGYNQATGDLQLQSDIANGRITYDQIYDDFVQSHVSGLYQRYLGIGMDEATASQAARQNAMRMAYQRIYNLGYRPDYNDQASVDRYVVPGMMDIIEGMEQAIGNNYWTNGASYNDRLTNMVSGGIEGRDDRLLDDLMSYSAGNAYLNAKNGTNYGTTFNITDPANADNPAGWNTALQAAMSGMLTKDQILHMYDSRYSDLVVPDEAKEFFTDPSHAIQQLYLNNGKNAGRTQSVEATSEEFQRALQALLDANPALKLMVDNGVLSTDDVAFNFFKELKLTDTDDLESRYRSYGGGGGYSRSYGSGGGGGGGGYGSSYGGGSASSKNQDDTRIHNIMKNWTF